MGHGGFRMPGTYEWRWVEVPEAHRLTYQRLAEYRLERGWGPEVLRKPSPDPDAYFPTHPEDAHRGRGSEEPGTWGCCPAAIPYDGPNNATLWYPCTRRAHVAYNGHCWVHRGGRKGESMAGKVRRTVTVDEEVLDHEPVKARVQVPLGVLTLGNIRAVAAAIAKAAEAANAPMNAEVEINTYGGETRAEVKWAIE